MKKILLAFGLLSLVITNPALARDRYKRHSDNTEEVVIAGILGIIIGSAITNSDSNRRMQRRDRDEYYYEDEYTHPRRPQYYERYCATEQIVDKYGRVYYRRICNR